MKLIKYKAVLKVCLFNFSKSIFQFKIKLLCLKYKQHVPTFQASHVGHICDANLFNNEPKLVSLLRRHNFPVHSNLKVKHEPRKFASSLTQSDREALAKFTNQTADLNELTFSDVHVIRLFKQHLRLKNKLSELVSDEFERTFANEDEEVRQFRDKHPTAYFYLTKYRGNLLEKSIFSHIKSRSSSSKLFNFEKHRLTKELNHDDLFRVTGRIDGVDDGRKMLIEIKTRSSLDLNKSTVSMIDHVQVLVYMKMFDCASCLFVECGPNGRSSLKETLIKFHQEQFEEYMNRVERFCKLGSSFDLDSVNVLRQLKNQNVIYI
jgi:hypothetical protein